MYRKYLGWVDKAWGPIFQRQALLRYELHRQQVDEEARYKQDLARMMEFITPLPTALELLYEYGARPEEYLRIIGELHRY